MLSATLHGAVAALVLLTAWAAEKAVREPPHIFELVAGGGDNVGARVAPALGDPSGVKFTPLPRPVPAQPVAAPAPVAAPVTPQSPAKVSAKTPVVIKTPAPATSVKSTAPAKVTTPQKPGAAAPGPVKVQHISAQGIAAGVVGGSTANMKGGAGGQALEREQASELDTYFSLLVAHLREAHVKPDGLSDLLHARVAFRLNANGSVAEVRIVEGSGNDAFDKSVIAAFWAMRALGPTPTGQPVGHTVLFTMRDGG
ncbi:MAG: TonB family protein [Verrucomicrobiota bacterium]